MKNKILLICIVSLLLPSVSFAFIIPTAKATFVVVDGSGNPIGGARIHLSFSVPLHNGWGTTAHVIQGLTDNEGRFSASSKTLKGIGATATKEGYYRSLKGAKFKNYENYLFFKRWIPWNPTIKIVLREKRNPVKMYRKCTGYIKVPVKNKKVGFDLVKGDWVAPYGQGEVNDFIFEFDYAYNNNFDWNGKYFMSFSNEGDGFMKYNSDKNINSEFKWPYEAPLKGYEIKKLNKFRIVYEDGDSSTNAIHTNLDKNQQYIFRVRTSTNSSGNIKSGMYGRMVGDVHISQKGRITICYYLNPTNRSLEYGGNLFKDED